MPAGMQSWRVGSTAVAKEERVAGGDVRDQLEAQGIERAGLGGDEELVAGGAAVGRRVCDLAAAIDEWADAVWVAQGEDAVAGDHRDDRVASRARRGEGFESVCVRECSACVCAAEMCGKGALPPAAGHAEAVA